MSTGEQHPLGENKTQSPIFNVIDIPESELSWRSDSDSFELILKTLEEHGLYSKDSLLFWGGEGSEILKYGHQNRTSTYAYTESQYKQAAEQDRTYGTTEYGGTALRHARHQSEQQPIICVYNAALFDRNSDNSDVNYKLKTDSSMDDATVAIIKLS